MILDTNALSAIADGEPATLKLYVRAPEIAIPVIVLGEYRYGIAHSKYKRTYESWLNEMISVCRILNIDEDTASWYANIRSQLKASGTPIPSNDIWIAALCRQHALPLLSHDRHFDSVNELQRLDW